MKKAASQKPPYTQHRGFVIIRLLLILFIISLVISACISFLLPSTEEVTLAQSNVALIRVEGPILLGGSKDLFTSVPSSKTVLDFIKQADANEQIRAIILEINSPGGTAVASQEIVQAIKDSNKVTLAWVREIGASGAYWVASATDHVISHDLSLVGSIGVISSYVDIAGLMDDHNVTYNRIVAGKYKDTGIPFRGLEPDERELLQSKTDLIYEYFVRDVAANRNMSYDDVLVLADGSVYLGVEASKNGLVDELGGYAAVEQHLRDVLNVTELEVYTFMQSKTFFERIIEISADPFYAMGRGIGDTFKIQDEGPVLAQLRQRT